MSVTSSKTGFLCTQVSILLLLAACSSGESTTETPQQPAPPAPPPAPPPAANNPPVLSGSPATAVTVGQQYTFTPTASDPEGDPLTFSVQNQPAWASFDSGDGSLSGVPTIGDTGSHDNIVISVSDGAMSASLSGFSIAVNQVALGSVSLSWTAPTMNEDGTPLVDLAGYQIYYGQTQGNYPNRITINNPGITSYVVDNLSPATYFFVSTSVNAGGIESSYSNEAVKTVN